MDSAHYHKVKQALIDVLEHPPDERARALERACAGDPALQAEVEALLAEEVDAGFLETGALEFDQAAEGEDLVGRKLGRIRIRRLIARGGMGMVFEGVDELLQRPVAVKLTRAHLQLSSQARAALLEEARVLSGTGHPNICEIHDFFTEGDLDVLVLELVDGSTLRQLLERGPLDHAPLSIAIQIADALASAHERGIAHLDLKPENVMLTRTGQVKVLDFGVARNLGTPATADGPGRAGGTPGYLAPEQARGEASTASDLWSFGVLLIELLTGSRPSPDAQGRTRSPNTSAPGRIRVPAGLPSAETALIKGLLADKPGDRPSARALRETLIRIQGRPRRRLAWGLAAAMMALLTFAGYRYATDLHFERNQAIAARAEAEELAGFMVEDLYNGLMSVGRLDLLEPVALKAVDYYGNLESGSVDPGRGEAALALLRVAEVLELQGHQDRSIDAFRRANRALEALALDRPDDPLIRYRLGLSRVFLGVALRFAGEQDEAAAVSSAAIELARTLTRDLDPHDATDAQPGAPTIDERWSLLLQAMFDHADGLVRVGRPEQAIPLIEEAEPLATATSRHHPGLRRNLGDIRWLQCLVYFEQQRVDGVIEACRASLEVDRARYLESPDDLERLAYYFDANWSLANAYRLSAEHRQALATADYAEQLARRLVAREPDRIHNQNRLAVILVSKGLSQRALDRREAMRASFESVLEITRPLMQEAELVIVNNQLTALAMLGRLDAARPLARQMYDGGWRRREFLALCREFELLPECARESSP